MSRCSPPPEGVAHMKACRMCRSGRCAVEVGSKPFLDPTTSFNVRGMSMTSSGGNTVKNWDGHRRTAPAAWKCQSKSLVPPAARPARARRRGPRGASSPSVSVPAFQPGRTVQALRILRAAIEMSNTRARHRLVRKRALTVFPTLIQMVAHAAMDRARDSALVGPPRLPPEA